MRGLCGSAVGLGGPVLEVPMLGCEGAVWLGCGSRWPRARGLHVGL